MTLSGTFEKSNLTSATKGAFYMVYEASFTGFVDYFHPYQITAHLDVEAMEEVTDRLKSQVLHLITLVSVEQLIAISIVIFLVNKFGSYH